MLINWSGFKYKKQAGVALIIKKDANITIDDAEYINSRIITASVTVYGYKLKFITCYSPTDCSNEDQKVVFYNNLAKTTNVDSRKRKLIYLGDFNATLCSNSICKNRNTNFNFNSFPPIIEIIMVKNLSTLSENNR